MDGNRGFRDQPQVDQIRDRIWSGREFGRAAVMVGAGFSRNANSHSPDVPPFPSWARLGEALYDVLYPTDTMGVGAKSERKQAASSIGAMRLASEYEIVFGRSSLDDFLARSLPDERYDPGRLHEMLLSLPWSDVFTTNYDTLLERARSRVYERKYDLALTVSDLPSQAKPRIVKLHGSLPSHRPFIITEDDYRTYPTKFAPFVNTVQQSIMENTFCLLGFSGEDPNFLNWTGWVRDNLGSSTPPVYLCGLLSLSNSQRRLLESRNVNLIDLSPQFPASKWHDPAQRHAKALEWFLLNLLEGQPPKVDGWPVPSRTGIRQSSEDLPEVPPGPRPMPDPGTEYPSFAGQTTLEEFRNLSESWRGSRLAYPGWVVAPERNRVRTWERTERWIGPVLGAVSRMDSPYGLFLLRELNWRLETCLVPLFTDWHQTIARVLNYYNPYPDLMDIDGATVKPDEDGRHDLDWDRVSLCWVELAFALARRAREDQDENEFRVWMERLANVSHQRSEWRARGSYEESIFGLSRLDQEAARKALEGWPVARGVLFWEVKRAAVLAELGDLEEAERVAGEALNNIRSRLQPHSSDYALLSQEGMALFLLEGIKANQMGTGQDTRLQYRDRLEVLDRYGSNPWTEIRNFNGTVVGLPPTPRGNVEEVTPGFDPNREITTTNFSSGYDFTPVLPAFALQKMIEDGPLLPRLGNVNMFSSIIPTAARWIEPYAPFWAFSSLLRYAKPKSIYERFDRVYVATLPKETVDHLFGILINSLIQSVYYLSANIRGAGPAGYDYSQRFAKISSELLSRLSFRISESQRENLIGLAARMYRLEAFREHHWLHECVTSLFKRILSLDSGASRTQILRWVPELLVLPIPEEASFQVSTPEMWVEPFDFIGGHYDDKLEADVDRSSWSSPITNLIRIVGDGVPEARKRALRRLDWLHAMGALTNAENEDFGQALWSRLDPNTGLPVDTRYHNLAFLRLPEPEPGKAKGIFRQRIRSMDFMRVTTPGSDTSQGTAISFSPGLAEEPYTRELLYSTATLFTPDKEGRKFVDWNLEEVSDFLRKMVERWDEEKEALRPILTNEQGDDFIKTPLLQRFEGWLRVMSEVILPRLREAPEQTKENAKRLVEELGQAGCHAALALPALLYVEPELPEEIAPRLQASIASGEDREARAALHGLFLWLSHSADGRINPPPRHLLDSVINRIISRRQAAMTSTLSFLRDAVYKLPSTLDDRQLDALCSSLEHFLEDTKLPEHKDMEQESREAGLIPVERRPEQRRLAAQLAYRLCEEFRRRGRGVPDILERWRQVCAEDSLPEVRHAWG